MGRSLCFEDIKMQGLALSPIDKLNINPLLN
jgi:hypothetical protein